MHAPIVGCVIRSLLIIGYIPDIFQCCIITSQELEPHKAKLPVQGLPGIRGIIPKVRPSAVMPLAKPDGSTAVTDRIRPETGFTIYV